MESVHSYFTSAERDARLQWAALDAEWNVPEGRIGGLIRQKRYQARLASKRADFILICLVIVIVIGIFFYLGLPFWKSQVDGRRGTLDDTMAALRQDEADLEQQWAAHALELTEALKNQVRPMPDLGRVWFSFKEPSSIGNHEYLFVGESSSILRYSSQENSYEFLNKDWIEEEYFDVILEISDDIRIIPAADGLVHYDVLDNVAEYIKYKEEDLDNSYYQYSRISDEEYLIFGDYTTVLKYNVRSKAASFVQKESVEYLNVVQKISDRLIILEGYDEQSDEQKYFIYSATADDFTEIEFVDTDSHRFEYAIDLGNGGSILYGSDVGILDHSSGKVRVSNIDYPAGVYFSRHEIINDEEILLVGSDSVLLIFDKKLEEFRLLDGNWGKNVYFRGTQELPNGAHIIYGSEGVLIKHSAGEEKALMLRGEWSDLVTFTGSRLWGENFAYVYGTRGVVVRADFSNNSIEMLQGDWPVSAHIHDMVPLDDGAHLFLGDEGVIIHHDPEQNTTHHLTGDWSAKTRFSKHIRVGATSYLIFGDLGTVVYFDARTFTARKINPYWNAKTEIVGAIPNVDGSFLLYGNDGTLAKYSDDYSVLAEQQDWDSETDILQFLETEIPYHVMSSEAVSNTRRELTRIAGLRSGLHEILRNTEAERKRLDEFPNSLLLLEAQREDFSTFMATCRSAGRAGMPSALQAETARRINTSGADNTTSACLEGWRTHRETEKQLWWQTLAQQVPPGILLLFLLSTLGGLYRYNLRLSGFHHSRADALELLATGRKDGEGMLSEQDQVSFLKMTDALAADKVEFGKANTPMDQAVSIAQSVLNRGA